MLECEKHEGSLEWYLKTTYAIQSGHTLQWLLSSERPVPDTLFLRLVFTKLYAAAKKFSSHILHTKLGVRFIIPDNVWEGYQSWSPIVQGQFAPLAWAHLNNGNLAVIASAFDMLSEKTRQHHIALIAESRNYKEINRAIIQELVFLNDPLGLPFFPEWPPNNKELVTPYAKIKLLYNDERRNGMKTNAHVIEMKSASTMQMMSQKAILAKMKSTITASKNNNLPKSKHGGVCYRISSFSTRTSS